MKKYLLSIVAALFAMTAVAQQAAPTNMVSYRGKTGQTFQFKVTGRTNGRIYGGSLCIYTDDSDLATAVVHAGMMKAGETKLVKVKVYPGQNQYQSLTLNGITSLSCGACKGSFRLVSSQRITENDKKPTTTKQDDRFDGRHFGRPQPDRNDRFGPHGKDRLSDKDKYNKAKQGNGRMTNRERADIVRRMVCNMVQIPKGSLYKEGRKTDVNAAIINKRAVTNREYAAATDVWLNRDAPDAPARVSESQRQTFIRSMQQAIGLNVDVRLAKQEEIEYADRNGYLSGRAQNAYIYYIFIDPANHKRYFSSPTGKMNLRIFDVDYSK